MCGGGSVEGAARYISVRCCRGQLFKFVVANGAKKKTRRLFFLLFPSHLDFCPPGERVLSRPRPPTVITPLLTTEAIGDWAGQASCGRQMKLATAPFCADRTLLLLSKEKRPKSLTCRLHCAKCRQTRRNCRKAAATETLTHLDDWLIARLCDETPLITHTHNIVFSAHTTFIFRSRIRDMATRFAHTRVSCLFVTSRRDPVVIEICGGSYYWSSLRFSISHRRGNDIT